MDPKISPKTATAMLAKAKANLRKAYDEAKGELNALATKLTGVQKTTKKKNKFSKAQIKHWGKINKAWKKFKAQKAEIKAMPNGSAKWMKRFSLAKEQLKLVQYNIRWTKKEVPYT